MQGSRCVKSSLKLPANQADCSSNSLTNPAHNVLSSTYRETNGAAEEEKTHIFQCKQLICGILVLLGNSSLDLYDFTVKILTECYSSNFIINFPPLPPFTLVFFQTTRSIKSFCLLIFPSCTFKATTVTGKDGTDAGKAHESSGDDFSG